MTKETKSTIEQSQFLEKGTKINQRYRIDEVLGYGGFGITYKAWDAVLQAPVAIKEYFPSGISTRSENHTEVMVTQKKSQREYEAGLTRMMVEAQSVAKFQDTKNIVRIFDYLEANGTAYIIMECLSGCTLKQYVKTYGTLDETRMLQVIMSVLEALEQIHEHKLIHRDISPENIFICKDMTVKLIDFGAAKQSVFDSDETLSIILKPGYAPPEQYARKNSQGPWTDIYSLGATLYYCATGEKPEDGVSRSLDDQVIPLGKKRTDLSSGLTDVIEKAMSVNKTERYQSATDMKQALLDAYSEEQYKASKKQKNKWNVTSENRGRFIAASCITLAIALGIWGIPRALNRANQEDKTQLATNLDATQLDASQNEQEHITLNEQASEDSQQEHDNIMHVATPEELEYANSLNEKFMLEEVSSSNFEKVNVRYVESGKNGSIHQTVQALPENYVGPGLIIDAAMYEQDQGKYSVDDFLYSELKFCRLDEESGEYKPIYPSDYATLSEQEKLDYASHFSPSYDYSNNTLTMRFPLTIELCDGRYEYSMTFYDKQNQKQFVMEFRFTLRRGVPEQTVMNWGEVISTESFVVTDLAVSNLKDVKAEYLESGENGYIRRSPMDIIGPYIGPALSISGDYFDQMIGKYDETDYNYFNFKFKRYNPETYAYETVMPDNYLELPEEEKLLAEERYGIGIYCRPTGINLRVPLDPNLQDGAYQVYISFLDEETNMEILIVDVKFELNRGVKENTLLIWE